MQCGFHHDALHFHGLIFRYFVRYSSSQSRRLRLGYNSKCKRKAASSGTTPARRAARRALSSVRTCCAIALLSLASPVRAAWTQGGRWPESFAKIAMLLF